MPSSEAPIGTVLERLSRIPGIAAAGGGTGIPPETPQRGTRFAIAGRTIDDPDEALQVVYRHRASRPLGRASFLVGRLKGEALIQRRLVFPAEVRDKVEALLGRGGGARA